MPFLIQTLLIWLSTAIAMQVADPSLSNESPKWAVEIHSKSLHVLKPRKYIVRSEKKRQMSSKIVMGAMPLPASRNAIQPAALMDPLTCSKDTKGTCSAAGHCDSWRLAECSGGTGVAGEGKCLCGTGMCAQGADSWGGGECIYPAINCKWADWEEWTPCDYTCGEGDRSRRRIIDTPAQYSGNECEGPDEETETCGMEDCPTTTTMQTTTAGGEEQIAAAPMQTTTAEGKKNSRIYLVGGGAAIVILGGVGAFLSQKRPKAATLDEFGETVHDDAATGEDYDYDYQ